MNWPFQKIEAEANEWLLDNGTAMGDPLQAVADEITHQELAQKISAYAP